eukprot:2957501-Prymnesium_polylepis.2
MGWVCSGATAKGTGAGTADLQVGALHPVDVAHVEHRADGREVGVPVRDVVPHLGGEEEGGEDDGPPRARVQQHALRARLQPVDVHERDDERLRREPRLVPDVVDKRVD